MYSFGMTDPPKGRGALSNPDGRFQKLTTEAVDDGWFVDETPSSIATHVEPDHARSIISTNDSPDIPFEYSVNPYRGCEHGCVYCMSGDTQILMADGTTRPLAEIRAGDSIYGSLRRGGYRRCVAARVLAHWSVVKPAYRITLADGTTLVAGSDHRFLTERGWRFVTAAQSGRAHRQHLTTGDKLMGVGAFAPQPHKDAEYRRGYLCGLIRGDGQRGSYSDGRVGRRGGTQHFRLAPCDEEALLRACEWLRCSNVETARFAFSAGSATRTPMHASRTCARGGIDELGALIARPDSPSRAWHCGFLAGIFDAEGSYRGGIIRISNTDPQIIGWASRSLRALGFECVVDHHQRIDTKPIDGLRVLGGLREHLRFFHSVDPALSRKRDISGQALKSEARLRIVGIEPVNRAMRLYDLTTSTGDFIAEGVVSHNCYARPSHAYLGLSPGLDFETRLLYKADAARVLVAELSRPGYVCKPITLGANTDPYQPIEKRSRVTRSILEVLHGCKHPVTIVTKGTLVLRDAGLLAEMAREGLATVAVSVTTLDTALKRKLEPRAAAPQARIGVIRELAAAGVPTGVLVAPVIPALTDHELEAILQACVAAGASRAGYVLLRLPGEVSTLFREWLAVHYPERARHVMSLLSQLRGGRDDDPRFGARMRGTGPYAALLRSRFEAACRRLRVDSVGRWRLSSTQFRPPGTRQLELGI